MILGPVKWKGVGWRRKETSGTLDSVIPTLIGQFSSWRTVTGHGGGVSPRSVSGLMVSRVQGTTQVSLS